MTGSGASASPTGPLGLRPEPQEGLGHSASVHLRAVEGEVLRPESCDDEIAAMMARLNKLQGWLVIEGCKRGGDRHFIAASQLIQDVRVLLVKRCFK